MKYLNLIYYQADQEIPEDDVYDYVLWNLNRILVGMGRSLADFPLRLFHSNSRLTEYSVLWDQFKARLCDDIKHKLHHMNPSLAG